MASGHCDPIPYGNMHVVMQADMWWMTRHVIPVRSGISIETRMFLGHLHCQQQESNQLYASMTCPNLFVAVDQLKWSPIEVAHKQMYLSMIRIFGIKIIRLLGYNPYHWINCADQIESFLILR